MEKVINIDGKQVKFDTSMSWVFVYKRQFGIDPLHIFVPAIKGLAALFAGIIKVEGNDADKDEKKTIEGNDADKDEKKTIEDMELTEVLSSIDEDSWDRLSDLMYDFSAEHILNLIWSLAKNADPEISVPEEWYRQFENFPVDEVFPMVARSALESSFSKKKLDRIFGIFRRPVTKET